MTQAQSERPDYTLDRWLGRIRTIIEILAVPTAAWWAFTRFERTEAPSLEQRLQIAADLGWDRRLGRGVCLAQFQIDVTNVGKAAVDVDSVHVLVWRKAEPDAGNSVAYLDPDSFQVGQPIWQRRLTGGLAGHYGPGIRSSEDYVFRVPVEEPGLLMFEFRALARTAGQGDTTLWSDYRWDYPCGSPANLTRFRPATGSKIRKTAARPR